ncbi:MAG: hypothetical protein EZS28_006622 [Streblomastix strix]|uniref:Uncharacterized protein n=1 Tax=Streblomastix strix TaxID=222440 RepID=A0A5J4WUK6_9EUKA|nr:MAG: hypothetical protein EZS28_006622 [Streblomastix strix]
MLKLFVFLLAYSVLAIEYQKGEKITFEYSTQIDTVGTQQNAGRNGIQESSNTNRWQINATANFNVLIKSSKGSYLSMQLSNILMKVGSGAESEDLQSGPEIDQNFSEPIYFTHLTDGTIIDTAASDLDEESTVSIKIGVLNSLRTNEVSSSTPSQQYSALVIDPHGYHTEKFKSEKSGGQTLVTSSYSQDDFKSFADSSIDPRDMKLKVSNNRVIDKEHIVKSESKQDIQFNKDYGTSNVVNGPDDIDSFASVFLSATGSHRLSQTKSGKMSNEEIKSFNYKSPQDFLKKNPQYKLVKQLQKETYLNILKLKAKENKIKAMNEKKRKNIVNAAVPNGASCPYDLTACQAYNKSWQIGGSNFGVRLTANAAVGMMKGCNLDTQRSYYMGAEVLLEGMVLGHTETAADAYAEYGLISGSASRNKIHVELFKKCGLEWSFGFTIVVVVLPITFNAGVRLTLGADTELAVCPYQLSFKTSFVPSATVSAFGGAHASIAIAKAGVEVEGSIVERLDPNVYINGSTCSLGYSIVSYTDPLTARLYGWYQTRKLTLGWGSKHEVTFWKTSLPTVTQVIDKREWRVV